MSGRWLTALILGLIAAVYMVALGAPPWAAWAAGVLVFEIRRGAR